MFLGRHVAQHGCAVPTDQGRADGRGDVVVARSDVRHHRAQSVERRPVTDGQLPFHVFLDSMDRHVTRTLDHHLHVVLPRNLGQAAQGFQLGELRLVVGVGQAARP